MNRFERELAARGTLNGRRWHVRRPAEISEVLNLNGTYFPGHWLGKSSRAAEFSLLANAALQRRALTSPSHPFYRQHFSTFVRRVREDVASSRELRMARETFPIAERRAAA